MVLIAVGGDNQGILWMLTDSQKHDAHEGLATTEKENVTISENYPTIFWLMINSNEGLICIDDHSQFLSRQEMKGCVTYVKYLSCMRTEQLHKCRQSKQNKPEGFRYHSYAKLERNSVY